MPKHQAGSELVSPGNAALPPLAPPPPSTGRPGSIWRARTRRRPSDEQTVIRDMHDGHTSLIYLAAKLRRLHVELPPGAKRSSEMR
jgi:hypothetical protein